MNHAVTIGFRTNGKPFVITGPEVPVEEQTAAFKELVSKGVEGCASIEIWTSSMGRTKRKKLRSVSAETPGEETVPSGKARKTKTT